MKIRAVAPLIRAIVRNAWNATLSGNHAMYERMGNPQIGDLVVELTCPGRDEIAVGFLRREAWELWPLSEPWDEKVEGKPAPTEKVFYIETLSGKEIRWTNAMFVAALTTWPFPDSPSS